MVSIQSKNEWLILVGILIFSLFLNCWNADFPPEYQGDELKKILFIQEGKQDFQHPILMLQAVRSLNYFLGFSKKMEVLELGRSVNAFCGTLCVFFTYLLARRKLSAGYALAAAFALAVSPIMVIHAHYLKEDMIFCCALLFAIYSLILFIENPENKFLFILLGIATGLAISAK
jgi:4-amino-4-deoxy-L-arabinose transferase-like glycosyltransferase